MRKESLERRQGLLTNGYQTDGNMFDFGTTDLTQDITQKVIHLEREKYQLRFEASTEGLIKNWPTNYGLYGWLISMKSGGELKPHMHENGWLSAEVYI